MLYAIDAVDTLFFRSAAPFDAGINYTSHSLFPPLPSVYAGALRSGVLLTNKVNLASKGKTISRQMKIGFNGLMVNNNFCFSRPLDTLVAENNKLEFLSLSPSLVSSYPLQFYLSNIRNSFQKEIEPQGGGCVYETDLRAYLAGVSKDLICHSLANHYQEEEHTGIQIDKDSGAAQDKKMYHIKMTRPVDKQNNKCSLVVEADGVSLPEDAILKIGGESKVAHLRRLDKSISLAPVSEAAKFFKLYLATPAIFTKGWLPWWIDEETKIGSFAYKKRRIRVKLICAAVGRYIPAGGFGSDHGTGQAKPREMRYAIPAGSVYFFQILEGTFEDANKLFHQQCISDYRENKGFVYDNWDRMRYCDRGFGYCLVGRVGQEQGGTVICTK